MEARRVFEIFHSKDGAVIKQLVDGVDDVTQTPRMDVDYVVRIHDSNETPGDDSAHFHFTTKLYSNFYTRLTRHRKVLDYLIDDLQIALSDIMVIGAIPLKKLCPKLQGNFKPVKISGDKCQSKIQEYKSGEFVYFEDPISFLCKELGCNSREALELWFTEKSVNPMTLVRWCIAYKEFGFGDSQDIILDQKCLIDTSGCKKYRNYAETIPLTKSNPLKVLHVTGRFIVIYEGLGLEKFYISTLSERAKSSLPPKFFTLFDEMTKTDVHLLRKLMLKLCTVDVIQTLRSLWSTFVSIQFLPLELSRSDYLSLLFGEDEKKIKLSLGPSPFNNSALKSGVSGVCSMDMKQVIAYKFDRRAMEDGFFEHVSTILRTEHSFVARK